MGPSGSGKSTLLNLIAGLDKPTAGTATVAGSELSRMNDRQLAQFRSQKIGFIFQAYNLLPVLTAVENVELPLLLDEPLGRASERSGRRPRSASSASRTACTTTRASSPAARSSAWRSPAPS